MAYVPGQYYQATGGITQATFEGPAYDKSIPVEMGFIRDGQSANKAIIAFNCSGQPLSVVLDDSREVNPQYGNVRWNEREKQGVILEDGRSTHFPIHPDCYHVSIGEYRIGEGGKQYWETSLARKLQRLRNTSMLVTENVRDGSLAVETNSNVRQQHYFSLENQSGRSIFVKITKDNMAYQPSQAAINAEKKSREPDQGNTIEEIQEIESGGRYCYKVPPVTFNVRGLQLMTPSATRRTQFIQIPPMVNYVELGVTQATAGQVVVFFMDEGGDGGVVSRAYPAKAIKFVNPTLAVTLPSR